MGIGYPDWLSRDQGPLHPFRVAVRLVLAAKRPVLAHQRTTHITARRGGKTHEAIDGKPATAKCSRNAQPAGSNAVMSRRLGTNGAQRCSLRHFLATRSVSPRRCATQFRRTVLNEVWIVARRTVCA